MMALPSAMTSYDARHVSFALEQIQADGDFDVVHDHSGFLLVAFRRFLDLPPVLHTVHCAFDTHAYPFYEQFRRGRGLRLDQRLPAHAGAARHELGRHRLQRPAGRRLAVRHRQGRLPAGLRARLRRQGLPPRHRHRAAHRPPPRSWPASCRTGIATTSRSASRPRSTATRSSSKTRSPTSASASCSPTPRRSSFRSCGPSRSAWS